MKKPFIAFIVIAILAAACDMLPQKAADKRLILWQITSECVKNQTDNNRPGPCEFVDLKQGYVVLKDIAGPTQYLVIATQRITGIESPLLLADNAPNYWEAAWASRKYMLARLGRDLARNDIGMAVNAPAARTQDQLHIHIDCVKPEVIKALGDYKDKLNHDWADLPFKLAGHSYQAMRIYSEDLHGEAPFDLLAVEGDMQNKTLVIVGEVFARNVNGFILLSDTTDLAKGDLGSGESLLDHSCAIAK